MAMERLTVKTGAEVRYIGKHTKHPGMEDASTMRVAARREVMYRLAAYEDTGLTPDQILKIKNLLQALQKM
jgi:hypothetical protein